MMGKDSTTSQLDFLLLKEVSNEAAEAISGGALTLGGSQEIELDHLTPLRDALEFFETLDKLGGLLGIKLPKVGDYLPSPEKYLPKIPKVPEPPELPMKY